MTSAREDLIAISRSFGLLERDQVCCGTVTMPQCVTLQALLAGAVEVTALAREVGNSPSAMTRLVDGLHQRGWVERLRDDEDRRRVRVALTEAGRAEADRLRALTDRGLAVIFDGIPMEKQPQVLESIALLRAAIEGARSGLEGCCGSGRS